MFYGLVCLDNLMDCCCDINMNVTAGTASAYTLDFYTFFYQILVLENSILSVKF